MRGGDQSAPMRAADTPRIGFFDPQKNAMAVPGMAAVYDRTLRPWTWTGGPSPLALNMSKSLEHAAIFASRAKCNWFIDARRHVLLLGTGRLSA